MKLALVLVWMGTLLANTNAADETFALKDRVWDPPDRTQPARDVAILERLWLRLKASVRDVGFHESFADPKYNTPENRQFILMNKYTIVLQSMLEFRAFINQHNDLSLTDREKNALDKCQKILSKLGFPGKTTLGGDLDDFVRKSGTNSIRTALLPILVFKWN